MRRALLFAALCASALAGACDVPTDGSSALSVRFSEPGIRVIVGESRRMNIAVEGSRELGRADVRFESLDPSVVRVTDEGDVIALGIGTGRVAASLRSFEQAGRDTLEVTVIAALSFDEIDVDEASYGQLVTVRGRALDPAQLEAFSLGGRTVRVASWTPADPGDPTSLESLSFWVPVGAGAESSLVGLHSTGATASRTMRVAQGDLHEPNDAQPVRIDDLASFGNPDLSFERGSGYDWYRFRNLPDDATLEVQLRLPIELVFGDVIVSAPRATREELPDWSIESTNFPTCGRRRVALDRFYYLDEDVTDTWFSYPLDLRGMDSIDVVIQTVTPPTQDLRYQVRVREGLVTEVPRDVTEPNDNCRQARPVPTTAVELTSHSGNDFDWFYVDVTERSRFRAGLVCSQCTEFPSFASLALFGDPDTATYDASRPLTRLASSFASAGEVALVDQVLEPGRYYLVAHNGFVRPLRLMLLSTSLSPVGN